MKFTDFSKLKIVVGELGASPIAAQLEKQLTGSGIPVSENTEQIVVGNNGIYFVTPDGVLTRTVIHIVDKDIGSRYAERIRAFVEDNEFESHLLIKDIHKYHLVKCKTIERAENEGWRSKYHISRRKNGTFFYRYLEKNSLFKINETQKLNVCKNCLNVINEISENSYTPETFDMAEFLSSDFSIINRLENQGSYEDMCAPNLYRFDWPEISKKYRALKGYQCEFPNCPHPDLSDQRFHKYLHTHHVSHDKTDNSYLNLKAYCIYCHAHQPNHGQLLNTPDYKRYVKLRGIEGS